MDTLGGLSGGRGKQSLWLFSPAELPRRTESQSFTMLKAAQEQITLGEEEVTQAEFSLQKHKDLGLISNTHVNNQTHVPFHCMRGRDGGSLGLANQLV